jgi:hypothetical protein
MEYLLGFGSFMYFRFTNDLESTFIKGVCFLSLALEQEIRLILDFCLALIATDSCDLRYPLNVSPAWKIRTS